MKATKIKIDDYKPVMEMLAEIERLNDDRKSWFMGFAAGMTYGIKQNTTTERAE